ncbi:MAG: NAD-dependent deacylase [Acidobacteria bacterium]|nr:NAD-dependent deacylase [Acidobacteriota bacterium]
MSGIDRAREILAAADRVSVLTGAGISAESGIPTFRGAGGLWRNFRPEELATPEAFARDPELVWEWYVWRRGRIGEAQPNAGHRAIAELERRAPVFTLITQNVDGLHDRAGSRNIRKVHGDIWISRCSRCAYQRRDTATVFTGVPVCPECSAPLRPGVVWFGESLPRAVWDDAERAVHGSQVLLIAGTSAQVYPAAGLIDLARSAGSSTIEVNLDGTAYSGAVTVSLRGLCGELLPQIVA